MPNIQDLQFTAQVAITCGLCGGSEDVSWSCQQCSDDICEDCKAKHDKKHTIIKRNRMLCINPCSVCSELYDVFWYCKTCKIYLCNTCKTKHFAKKKRQGHTVVERKRNIKIFKSNEKHRANSTTSLCDQNSAFSKEILNSSQTKSKSPVENALVLPDQISSYPKVPKRLDSTVCFDEIILAYTAVPIENDEMQENDTHPCKYVVYPAKLHINRHKIHEIKEILKCYIHCTADCSFVCLDCKVTGCEICSLNGLHDECMQLEMERVSASLSARINDTEICLHFVETCLSKVNKFLRFLYSTKIDKDILQLLFLCDKAGLISCVGRDASKLEQIQTIFSSGKNHLQTLAESCKISLHNCTINIYHFLGKNLKVFEFESLREDFNILENWSVDEQIAQIKTMHPPKRGMIYRLPKHSYYALQPQVTEVDPPRNDVKSTRRPNFFVFVIVTMVVALVAYVIRLL